MCGETFAGGAAAATHTGLSPRVRGNLLRVAADVCFLGSIPACAGKPAFAASEASPRGVYPRVCGETLNGPKKMVF